MRIVISSPPKMGNKWIKCLLSRVYDLKWVIGEDSPDTNIELSGQRALTVKAFVVAKGVPKERVVAVGCGQAKPIADNSTEEGKAKNRRTEFRIAELNGKKYMGKDPTGGCKPFE